MAPLPPILIAYDGSDAARAAIRQAGTLLRLRRAVVAYVWAPLEDTAAVAAIGAPGGVTVAGARRLDAAEQRRAERVAQEGAHIARRAGFAAEALAIRRDGAPWRALVERAEALDVVAIVAGSRGRSLAASAVLGSTAEGLLHHARRPVIVVSGA